MKKILFSDYDKTLYINEDGLLKNIEAIKKFRDKGHLFTIATGRAYYDLKDMIKNYQIPFDYLILNHGAFILDSNFNIIHSIFIDNNIVEEIFEAAKQNSDVFEVVLYDEFNKYINEKKDNIIKIVLKLDSEDKANHLSNEINSNYQEIKSYVMRSRTAHLVEIICTDVDKSIAIKKILKITNIEKQNTFVIGDGPNDVEAIKDYNGFGMEISNSEVYKVAKKLYKSVSDLIEEIIN